MGNLKVKTPCVEWEVDNDIVFLSKGICKSFDDLPYWLWSFKFGGTKSDRFLLEILGSKEIFLYGISLNNVPFFIKA